LSPLRPFGQSTPTDEVHEYDPASDPWRQLAALPTPRSPACRPRATTWLWPATDGRLYAVGGRVDGNYSRNLAANEATDRWEARVPLPTARKDIAAAVLDGRTFVFGGEGARRHLSPGGSLRWSE
jgi:N-acetylneuraminic acid mutarotase